MKYILLSIILLLSVEVFANQPILEANGLLSFEGDETAENVSLSLSSEGLLIEIEVISDGTLVFTSTYPVASVKQFRFINKQAIDVLNIMPELTIPTEVIHYDARNDRLREMVGMFNLVKYLDVTHRSATNGMWSDSNTWENGIIPTTGARVLIQKAHIVQIGTDVKDVFKTVRVDGTLDFKKENHSVFRVNTMVVGPTGSLQIGQENNPIVGSAKIIFSKLIDFETQNSNSPDYDPHRLGLGLISHGNASIYGLEKTGYATSDGAKLGDSFIQLHALPLNWKVGDEIAIAGTSNDGLGVESRIIASVDYGSNRIRLNTPLEKNHQTIAHTKEGLKLKIHVINTTRNIVFETSDLLSQRTIRKGIDLVGRGHLMFMHTNNAKVHYAAFRHMGRTDKQTAMTNINIDSTGVVISPAQNPLARYPLHFHRAGALSPGEVVGSAVVNSPGWGFVNHSSHVNMKDNVAFHINGAGFVSEAGNEKGSFVNNIAMNTFGHEIENLTAKSSFTSRAQININDFGSGGDGFWFHSSDLIIEDNIASGFTGSGFFFWDQGIDGVDHKTNELLTQINISNSTAYGGHTGLNMAFVEEPEGAGLTARNAVWNFVAWNVERGVRKKYAKWIDFIDVTLINDINRPFGQGVSSHSNGRKNVFINPHIEGFIEGIDFEHKRFEAGIYGGYLNNVINCDINVRHERVQKVLFNNITFGSLSPEALSTVDATFFDGFDVNQYHYFGFLNKGGKLDEGFVEPDPATKDGKISNFYIVQDTIVSKAYLSTFQHPDFVPWTNDEDPAEWLNLSNSEMQNSGDPSVMSGVIASEHYLLNEVSVPEKTFGIVVKGAGIEDVPYLDIVVNPIDDIIISVSQSVSFDLPEVFINPNPLPFEYLIESNTDSTKVKAILTGNLLDITGLAEGSSTVVLKAMSDFYNESVIDTVLVTVLATPVAPEVMDDHYTVAFETATEFSVLENDSETITAIVGVGNSANGTLQISPEHTVIYTPQIGFSGLDTISYTVTDQFGEQNTATVTIEVKPLVYDLALEVLEGAELHLNLQHPIAAVTNANFGLTNSDNTELIYSQTDPNHNGSDQFNYTINGQTANVAITIISIKVPEIQEQELFGDGFESGDFLTEGWVEIEPLIDLRKILDAFSGRWSLRVRHRGKIQKTISTTGFKDIKISFARKTSEAFDTFPGVVNFQWSLDEIDWNILLSDNSHFPEYELLDFQLPDSASNKENLTFGIFSDSSRKSHRTHVDIVRITGTPITTIDPTLQPEVNVVNAEANIISFNIADCDNNVNTVSITNEGNKELLLNNFSIVVDPVFELVNSDFVDVLLPGATFSLYFKTNLQEISNGTSGTITFQTNDLDEPNITLTLQLNVIDNLAIEIIEAQETTLTVPLINGASYQWHTCNGAVLEPIANATNNFYIPEQEGEFAVKAFIGNNCELMSNCQSILTLSNDDFNAENSKISIYPNPVNDILNIIFANTLLPETIALFDIHGRIIYSLDVLKNRAIQFDISSLSSGIYFIKFNGDTNNIPVHKIIKQ